MDEQVSGGCACGRVRYSVTIHDHDAYLCHCRMCQRATGSVSIAFKSVRQAEVRWENEPDWYDSSPIGERSHCRQCGTSFGFRYKGDSPNIDLTVASFDDPSPFVPKHHFGAESMHRAWINTEQLPEFRTDQHQKLVDKWVEATGQFPG
jgi:hypothetical protein